VAGSYRVRRSSTFWDELLRVWTLSPRSRAAPAHAFLEQDAPHLAVAVLDAHLSGGVGLGVQGPVGGLRLVEGRLLDLARQAEVAVQAVRLSSDLQRSRERLVSAREEKRRQEELELEVVDDEWGYPKTARPGWG
jgi:hypothetical protein